MVDFYGKLLAGKDTNVPLGSYGPEDVFVAKTFKQKTPFEQWSEHWLVGLV